MTSVILLILGLLMIFLEFYLPGAILGTVGGITVLFSVVLFAMNSDSLVAIIVFTAVAILSVVLLFKFALWRLKSGKTGIYSGSDQEGYVASTYDKSAIGKIGVVESDLKPGGHIRLEGVKLQAISVSGYLAKGEKVLVIGGEGESLTVKKI